MTVLHFAIIKSPFQPDEEAIGNDPTPTLVKRLVGMPGDGDTMRHLAWQATGDLRYLEDLYADQIKAAALREEAPSSSPVRAPCATLRAASVGATRPGRCAIR